MKNFNESFIKKGAQYFMPGIWDVFSYNIIHTEKKGRNNCVVKFFVTSRYIGPIL